MNKNKIALYVVGTVFLSFIFSDSLSASPINPSISNTNCSSTNGKRNECEARNDKKTPELCLQPVLETLTYTYNSDGRVIATRLNSLPQYIISNMPDSFFYPLISWPNYGLRLEVIQFDLVVFGKVNSNLQNGRIFVGNRTFDVWTEDFGMTPWSANWAILSSAGKLRIVGQYIPCQKI